MDGGSLYYLGLNEKRKKEKSQCDSQGQRKGDGGEDSIHAVKKERWGTALRFGLVRSDEGGKG